MSYECQCERCQAKDVHAHEMRRIGAQQARAEIVAKLRERAGKLTRAGEMGGSTLITDALMLAATELESFATELEAGCQS